MIKFRQPIFQDRKTIVNVLPIEFSRLIFPFTQRYHTEMNASPKNIEIITVGINDNGDNSELGKCTQCGYTSYLEISNLCSNDTIYTCNHCNNTLHVNEKNNMVLLYHKLDYTGEYGEFKGTVAYNISYVNGIVNIEFAILISENNMFSMLKKPAISDDVYDFVSKNTFLNDYIGYVKKNDVLGELFNSVEMKGFIANETNRKIPVVISEDDIQIRILK